MRECVIARIAVLLYVVFYLLFGESLAALSSRRRRRRREGEKIGVGGECVLRSFTMNIMLVIE